MPDQDFELSQFFAWARARAYEEFERRMDTDPELDPNWLFSDIMQELLEEYKQMSPDQLSASSQKRDRTTQGEHD